MPDERFPSSEYRAIEGLRPYLNEVSAINYALGVGDDAAIRICRGDEYVILTGDLSVQDVHFSLDYMSLVEVGSRAMVSNLSDCAAMGAVPDGAMVQVVIPKSVVDPREPLQELYRGISEAVDTWKTPVIGGDLSRGPCWIVAITLLGRRNGTPIPRILTRRGMNEGDAVFVTGNVGESGAGFSALRQWGRSHVPENYRHLVERHIFPTPRISQGMALADNPCIHCMMDISDGVAKECLTLAFDNQMGIILKYDDTIVSAAVRELSEQLNVPWDDWFLHGGEDYELIFTADSSWDPPESIEGVCVRKIGSATTSTKGVHVDLEGHLVQIERGGWDHL